MRILRIMYTDAPGWTTILFKLLHRLTIFIYADYMMMNYLFIIMIYIYELYLYTCYLYIFTYLLTGVLRVRSRIFSISSFPVKREEMLDVRLASESYRGAGGFVKEG